MKSDEVGLSPTKSDYPRKRAASGFLAFTKFVKALFRAFQIAARFCCVMEMFLEYQTSSERGLTVDAARGVVRDVKVLGRFSKNGREYSEDAMRQAASMYEGAKVYLNHPSDGKAPRLIEGLFGELRGVKFKGDGLYAESLNYNPSHPFANQFAWAAKNQPRTFGLSHNISGNAKRVNGKVVVESITKVNSVDLVAEPATTNGLHEQVEGEIMNVADITLEHVKSRPELVEAILADNAEVKSLRESVAKAKRKGIVDKALKDAGLQESDTSEVFMATLMECKEDAIEAHVKDRASLLNSGSGTKRRAPASREQRLSEGTDRKQVDEFKEPGDYAASLRG